MAERAKRDFLRFRERGDSQALARVFDALAPRLLLLAAHVVRDQARAEDVVQETFLRVMRESDRYDASRPLFPWLIAILQNEARNARRADQRALDPERVDRSEATGPLREAEERDLLDQLSQGVANLPHPYREVLNLRFAHGLSGVEIAHALGRPLATVHTQLRRGTEMLRRALPAGLAAVSVESASGRGLAAVRREVLAVVRSTTPITSAFLSSVGGVLVMKKIVPVLVVGLLILLAIMGLIATDDPSPAGTAGPSLPMTAELESDEPRDAPQLEREAIETRPANPVPGLSVHREPLTGIVVTLTGELVPGVEVILEHRAAQSFGVMDLDYLDEKEVVDRTMTAEDGTFSFVLPSLRAFVLRTQAPGFAPATVLECYPGQELVVTLEAGASLEGTVTRASDHTPIEGTEVWVLVMPQGAAVLGETNFMSLGKVQTDARGFYRMVDLPPIEIDVLVLPPEGTPRGGKLALEPGRITRHDVEIERGKTVTGRVMDALTGQPIMGAEIAEDPLYMGAKTRTMADGSYALEGNGGLVVVRARGYGQQSRLTGASTDSEVSADFQLEPARSAEGRIVNSEGQPMAGVYVAAMASRLPAEMHFEWHSARSGPDGRFRLVDLRTDVHHSLFVRQTGYGTRVYAFPRPAIPEAVVQLGDVVLRTGSGIQGQVLNQNEEPVAGIKVSLIGANRDYVRLLGPGGTEEDSAREVRKRSTWSDGEGAFRFGDLSPGTYSLQAGPEGSWFRYEIEVADWDQMVNGFVARVDLGLSISGSVRTPTGEEREGDVIVTVVPEAPTEDSHEIDWLRYGETEFSIRGMTPGLYTVRATAISQPGETRRWIDGQKASVRAGSRDVEVLLRAVATVEGRILTDSGSPAPGIMVYASIRGAGDGFPSRAVLTDSGGRFRLEVAEGDLVDVIAGPPADERPGYITFPDPEKEVTVEGIRAGTRDLVVRLR